MSVRVVLVRPEQPANVGAVARVIANTALAGLDLVEPCDWIGADARRLARHAHGVLRDARRFETLESAVADARHVAALCGRRGPRVASMTVRDYAESVGSLPMSEPVSVVFGPESRGLTEGELLLCQRRVRIPADQRQPSLNLAQAVMVVGYELFVARGGSDVVEHDRRQLHEGEAHLRAVAGDVEAAYAQLIDAMLAIDFLPVENPEARFVEWRALFGRAGLSVREVSLLRSLARRMRGAGRAARRVRDRSAENEGLG